MDITFYELHDDISEPLTVCADCAPQAVAEGFRLGAKLVGDARCDSCGAESAEDSDPENTLNADAWSGGFARNN